MWDFTYVLTDKIKKDYLEFKDKHYKKHKRDSCSLIFTPTGIGTGVDVVCNICKKKIDISHVEDW